MSELLRFIPTAFFYSDLLGFTRINSDRSKLEGSREVGAGETPALLWSWHIFINGRIMETELWGKHFITFTSSE
jgi:hypothetical protein